MSGGVSRRELVRDGIAAGVGVAGAGATLGALTQLAAAAVPVAQVEAQALTHALQIEQLVVIAYRQAVSSRYIGATVNAQLRTHLGHELEHVGILGRALAARGAAVPPPPTLPAAQAALARHQVHWSLTQLRSQHDFLKLLVDVESLAENAYFQAVGMLQDVALAVTSAEIMGCEAQHWTVLSGFLNHQDAMKAVPYPFVEGTP